MLYNAKCFVRSLIAKTQFDQVINLVNLQSQRVFIQDVRRTKKILLKCPNNYYVSKTDKRQLKGYDSVLDRSHLTYLMRNDPELVALSKPQEGRIPIYMNMIEYSFGLLHRTVDQMLEFDN